MSLPRLLQTLHRMHRQVSDLRDRIRRIPQRTKVSESNLKALEAELAAEKENWRAVRRQAEDKQSQLRTREDRVANRKGKLNEANSNRDYKAIQDEIAADTQANAVLQDEILELLERLDEVQKKSQERTEAVETFKKEHARLISKLDDDKVALEKELVRVEGELIETEKQLSGDVVSMYRAAVRVHGENGLAVLEDGSCGNCNHLVTPNVRSDVEMGRPVACKQCGSLMYVKHD